MLTVTDADIARMTRIVARNTGRDDAADHVADAVVWYLSQPQPLTEPMANRPMAQIVQRARQRALNARRRDARLVYGRLEIRYQPPDMVEARQKHDARIRALARITPEERALLLAERGTVTPTERVRRHRLIARLRKAL